MLNITTHTYSYFINKISVLAYASSHLIWSRMSFKWSSNGLHQLASATFRLKHSLFEEYLLFFHLVRIIDKQNTYIKTIIKRNTHFRTRNATPHVHSPTINTDLQKKWRCPNVAVNEVAKKKFVQRTSNTCLRNLFYLRMK